MVLPSPPHWLLWALLLPLPGQEAQQDWRDEVAALRAAGELDRVALFLERRLEESPGDAEMWRELARSLERMVTEGGASWLVMDEAREAWDGALAVEPLDVETLIAAADLRLRLGDFTGSATLCMRALGAVQLSGEPTPPRLLALACRARTGEFQAAEHTDLDAWTADLDAAWGNVRRARELAGSDGDPGDGNEGELVLVQAGFADALGCPGQAIRILFDALARTPDDAGLHRMLVEIHLRERIEGRLPEAYDRLNTADPTVEWYHGYAARLIGDGAARERDFERARSAYAQCIDWMSAVATLAPDFAESARQVRVQAEVSSAWCAYHAGDFEEAEARTLALLRDETDLRAFPDGLGRTMTDAASAVAGHWADLSAFQRAAGVARAVLAVAPDDGRWWNNLGFLLREYSTQVEIGLFPDIADPKTRAREIARESWSAYKRAAELIPDDARVVNDAALIQVYHLEEDLELAETLLWQAIRAGEAQLEALGPEPADVERFPLAQAVGDAYENLGYLYYHLYEKPLLSREYWVASLETDSGDRQLCRDYIDAIDGKREPVEKRDQSGFVEAPRDSLPAPVDVPWEASLAEARAVAESEKRALLIYNRGDALGLVVPFLDQLARSERLRERAADAVFVVADPLRHNFVDRRRDGRRLACPKWGTITCSEHIACADEFVSWYVESRAGSPAGPGESEEGLWIRRPGDDEPAMLRDFGGFFGEKPEAAQAGAVSVVDLDDVVARLEGPNGVEAARRLVAIRRRAARDRIEEVLFDGSPAAREVLVPELARDDAPTSRELCAALVDQRADAELARLVLAAWPSGADLAPVERAERWSLDEGVRAAAAEVLARELPDWERRVAARRVLAR